MTPPAAAPSDGRATVETTSIPVDGTRLCCRSAGSGPPLVFVHAGIADGRLWRGQLDAFADRFRVVAYDLRGFGDSPRPPGPYAHHRDLAALLDALDVDAAHLVGASMGGATVLDVALERPDRVASLALVAPALGGYEFTDEATLAAWAAAGEAFEAGALDRAAAIETDMWFVGPSRRPEDVDRDGRALVRAMVRRSYDHETDDATEVALDPPAIDRLDELAVPVLLVRGALDRPDARAIADVIEGSVADVELAVVDGAAHLPSLERPDVFDELLGAFLDRVADRER